MYGYQSIPTLKSGHWAVAKAESKGEYFALQSFLASEVTPACTAAQVQVVPSSFLPEQLR